MQAPPLRAPPAEQDAEPAPAAVARSRVPVLVALPAARQLADGSEKFMEEAAVVESDAKAHEKHDEEPADEADNGQE